MSAPDEPPKPERDTLSVEERSIDPALIAGAIGGVGAALSGPLQALTEHYLDGREPKESPPEIVLPPGVPEDD